MLGPNILVAYDGSELAEKTLSEALSMSHLLSQAKIDVLFVEEVKPLRTGAEAVDADIQSRNDRLCEDLKKRLASRSEPVTFHRLRGQGASYVILRFAEEEQSDLIIIGSRGLTGVREMLGSVSHAVIQHALVPVLVIK
ncbi:universal stress protein [Breoghania sp.]|uniref:universal stress protein n=1 Tax=Breoghania sp. TaxID=2065378 RepID=UPI0026374927|nr:universal stress protein [Breoghania sp.]MDJ0932228.1 universal stress protein [Breoghania sp.]